MRWVSGVGCPAISRLRQLPGPERREFATKVPPPPEKEAASPPPRRISLKRPASAAASSRGIEPPAPKAGRVARSPERAVPPWRRGSSPGAERGTAEEGPLAQGDPWAEVDPLTARDPWSEESAGDSDVDRSRRAYSKSPGTLQRRPASLARTTIPESSEARGSNDPWWSGGGDPWSAVRPGGSPAPRPRPSQAPPWRPPRPSAAAWTTAWTSAWWGARSAGVPVALQPAAGPDMFRYNADMDANFHWDILKGIILVLGIWTVVHICILVGVIWCIMHRNVHGQRPVLAPPASAEQTGPDPPGEVAEGGAEHPGLRRRRPDVECFYVQTGRKMHTDRSCCGMFKPQRLVLPAEAVPFVEWCRHCSADLTRR